jgi:hypothetical protein
MNTLIDNVVAYLTAGRNADPSQLSAKIIKKGFGSDTPDQIPIERYPFVEVDEGGEAVESNIAAETQNRIYKVVLFMAVLAGNEEKSLTDILQLSDEVKTLFEKEENRQLDGHRWAVTINPVTANVNDNGIYYFFRGREVVVEFEELEDNYGEF